MNVKNAGNKSKNKQKIKNTEEEHVKIIKF